MQKCQEVFADEQGGPGQTLTQEGSIQRMEARTGNLGGVHIYCLNMQG